jgi:hypothetical protein
VLNSRPLAFQEGHTARGEQITGAKRLPKHRLGLPLSFFSFCLSSVW